MLCIPMGQEYKGYSTKIDSNRKDSDYLKVLELQKDKSNFGADCWQKQIKIDYYETLIEMIKKNITKRIWRSF